MKKLLRNKAFRLLALATTISSLGDSLYALAITLSVYEISGSIVGVTGMWMIRAVIRIPCQFFSGILVDRYDRKKISIAVYLLSAVVVFCFVLTNSKYLVLAFVLIFILQGTSDIDNMSQLAIMPEVIEEELLTDANSVFCMIGTVIMLIGPGIGGLLYKLSGEEVLYIIDAITFLLAAVIMAVLPYTYQKEEAEEAKF